jgi:hypothetical protein
MFTVTLRFYGSLNDFLPQTQHNQIILQELAEHAAVKHPIESLGVPHPEVEAIAVDGRPVDFSYRLHPHNHVEVYPYDWETLPRERRMLRPPPPAPIRFVADAHLGRLAAYLRMLGFDTLYRNDYDDQELAAIAAEQQRVLLTRDRGLLKHKSVVHGLCVRSVDPQEQIVEVLQRYRLATQVEPWRRCTHCNGRLYAVDKSDVLELLEPKTKLYYDEFQQCDTCSRIYWQGSHFERMADFVEAILRRV